MTRARDTANLVGSGNFSSTTFTATAGQTAFTISHTQGFVQVFMNGLLLDETVDYASNGTAITLTSGAAVGDEIEVVAYNTFSVGDAISASGGAFTGEVLVGKTVANFATAGTEINSSGRVFITYDGGGALQLNRKTSDGDIIELHKDGTEIGSIGIQSTGFYVDGEPGHAGIRFAGNELSPRDNGADADGVVSLGESDKRWKDLYLSGGAYIGGTAAANHLDDYEEGTFNLTLAGYYSNPSTTQTIAGYYTKVGNVVHIFCRQGAINNTGASGHMWCTGLPFASNTPYTVLSCTMDYMGTYPNSSPMAYCAGSIAYIDKHVDQGARTAVFHNVTTSGVITITGSYRI